MNATTMTTPRKISRQPVYLEATIESGMVIGHGRLLNLAEGGLFIATDLRLPLGARVTVTQREAGVRRMRATGVVVHRTPYLEHDGLGIRFLSPAVAAGVRAMLDDIAIDGMTD